LVTAVESALETAMSARMMQGSKRSIERFPKGTMVVKEGEPGTHVLLILDGVVRIDRGGERLAEYGPGALLGERAHLEGGMRTSTIVAVTPCRVALFEAAHLDQAELEQLSAGHRREDAARY
jgi:CRP-like cAMP-binding protein